VAYCRDVAHVRLDSITKTFGDVTAVDDITLDVADHDFMILLGPSGCGKSTLLRVIAGLEDPSRGDVFIGDIRVNDIEPKQRDVAMVFQSYALYPHKTVQANIEFPLKVRGVSKEERAAQAIEAADSLGLRDQLSRRPGQLSGGQRQRVALARAIVRHPAVFCMDEPLSNLDAKLRSETRAELVALHRRLSSTFIYVTHDQVEAMTMGTHVAVMNRGRIEQVGTPAEVYARPASVFVAGFIGTPPMNIFPAGMVESGDLLIGVRPEHLQLDTSPGTGSAGTGSASTGSSDQLLRVDLVEQLGHETLVHGRVDDTRLVVRLATDQAPTIDVGDDVGVRLPTEHRHRFHPESGLRIDERLS
jgi:multiple sugar transport system ATP-binding protein